MRSIQQDRDGTRTISGVIDGSANVIVRGTGFTMTKQGAGVYLLNFPGFKTVTHAVVNAHAGATGYVATCSIYPDRSLQVWGWIGVGLGDMIIGVQITGLAKIL